MCPAECVVFQHLEKGLGQFLERKKGEQRHKGESYLISLHLTVHFSKREEE